MDGVLRLELYHDGRRLGATEMSNGEPVDGGLPGDLVAYLPAEATTPVCGEQMVLRLSLLSGKSPYSNIYPIMTSP
jgi:hypothetical protein